MRTLIKDGTVITASDTFGADDSRNGFSKRRPVNVVESSAAMLCPFWEIVTI